MYRHLLKHLLFLLPAETAHHLTLSLLKLALAFPPARFLFRQAFVVNAPWLERKVLGLNFPNPVGLAAGFDKDGRHFAAMAALGFGFIEIGTVTPLPQAGNPKPRLFRLPADNALVNRMGFNNRGVEAMVRRLQRRAKGKLIIGGNIGKNKDTPNEKAVDDYARCFEALFPWVDYFVVNVSSPNTPGLRELQGKEPLTALLAHLQSLNHQQQRPKPLLLKIAPDLSDGQLDDILDIARQTKLDGIIATNTTVGREGLRSAASLSGQAGGLSGAPLRERATEVIRYLSTKSAGKLTIIGVGGIASAADALEKLEAGASLVQIYTGLVYAGPGLVREINNALLEQGPSRRQG